VTRERREVKTIKVGMNKISGSRYNRIEEEQKLANVESTLCQSIGDPDLSELVHVFSGVIIRAKVGSRLRVVDRMGNALAQSQECIAGRNGSLGEMCSEPLCKVVGDWVYFVDQKCRSLVRYSVKAFAQKMTIMPRETVISGGVNSFDSHKGDVWALQNLNVVSCGTKIMHLKTSLSFVDLDESFGHLVCQGRDYCLAIISSRCISSYAREYSATRLPFPRCRSAGSTRP